MKRLEAKDAQRIINIACDTWKSKLANKWGATIALGEYLEVKDDFYKSMREACTPDQHKLFDEIFGKDDVEFKVGDWVVFSGCGQPTKVKEVKTGIALVVHLYGYGDLRCLSPNCRLATEEEVKEHLISEAKRRGLWDVKINCLYSSGNYFSTIDAGEAYVYYNIDDDRLWSRYGAVYEKGKWATPLEEWPKKGTVCLVWDDEDEPDKNKPIRVSDGKGKFNQWPSDDSTWYSYDHYEIFDPSKHMSK